MSNKGEIEILRERNLRLVLAVCSNSGSPSLCHLVSEVQSRPKTRKMADGTLKTFLGTKKFDDNYFSRVFHGEKLVTDSDAKKIEEILDLPKNWLDEDHSYLTKLTNIDNKLIKQIISLSDESKQHLMAFIESLKTAPG